MVAAGASNDDVTYMPGIKPLRDDTVTGEPAIAASEN